MIPISLPRYPERNHRTSWPRGTFHPVEASAWNLFWRYECRRCRHPLSTFQLTLPMILPQSRDVRRTSPLNFSYIATYCIRALLALRMQ
jgi:hypothetical protein